MYGAASLVLEDYEHAKARGANILAEVIGYGFSSNGGGISQPSDEGSVVAMTRALDMSGVKAEDIDYINAHATSTHQGDMYEAMALNRMFGGKHALISSTKSMTGHECWMAGAQWYMTNRDGSVVSSPVGSSSLIVCLISR